ncbi:MAG TPA: hypothetical protein VLT33_15005, partial [Labilithrix sp.]|nr:hypothetical protein [Labilithrix sp.]
VRLDKRSRFVRLMVVDVAADAPPLEGLRLALRPTEKDSDAIAAALGDALKDYAPAAEEPAEPVAEPEVAPAPPAEPAPALPDTVPTVAESPRPAPPRRPTWLAATSLLDLSLGAEATGRHYVYDNGIARTSYVYRLPVAPATRVAGTIHPFAARGRPAGDLGVAFDYARSFLRKSDFDGARQGSAATSYAVGLRGRIRPAFGAAEPRLMLAVAVQYAFSSFDLTGPPTAELPAVTYRALRPSLDVRVRLGRFSLLGAAAFRALVDADGISSRFSGPHGFGFDAELGGAFMFATHFEARLVTRYQRYALGLTPPSGATFSPGRATDQWYALGASLALLL